jgi:hypothetical protein
LPPCAAITPNKHSRHSSRHALVLVFLLVSFLPTHQSILQAPSSNRPIHILMVANSICSQLPIQQLPLPPPPPAHSSTPPPSMTPLAHARPRLSHQPRADQMPQPQDLPALPLRQATSLLPPAMLREWAALPLRSWLSLERLLLCERPKRRLLHSSALQRCRTDSQRRARGRFTR